MTFIALLVASLALGLRCARVLPWDALRPLRGVGALALLACVAPWFLHPMVVAGSLTVLHEGGTRRLIDATFGHDEHVGPLWLDAARALAAVRDELPILAIVRLNLTLATLSAAGLAAVVWVVSGRVVAVAVALFLLLASRGFWNAAWSETPAPAVWLAFVTAAPAWKILDEATARPHADRLLAVASLSVSAALAASVRGEFALPGAIVVSLGAHSFASTGDGAVSALARLEGVVRRLLHAPWPARLAAVGVIAWLLNERGRLDFHLQLALVAALPSALTLQGVVAMLAVTPVPVVALSVLGFVTLARGGPARVAFAWSTLSLLAVHVVASHGVGWEMLRYGAHDAMALWLAAAVGWRALEDIAAARGWHPAWRSSLAMVAVTAVVMPAQVDPAGPAWWDADARRDAGDLRQLAHQSSQREARQLLRAMTAEPECLFVGRMRRWGERRGPMSLVTFGVGRPIAEVTDRTVSVRDLRSSAGRCLRYLRTLDCDLRPGTPCDDDLRGAQALRVVRERLAVYSDPGEYGEHTPEVRYGVWRVGD